METGPELGNSIVIERGLVQGEDIVTEGYHKLVAWDEDCVTGSRPERNDRSSL